LTTSGKVALMLKTDAVSGIPNGIRYEVQDADGYIIKERGNFQDGATIRDTFDLENGCYRFVIYDEALGDGLYPIFQGSTRGFYSLREVGGSTIIFNSQAANYGQPSGVYASFGDREIIPFRVNTNAVSIDEGVADVSVPTLNIAPNPTLSGIANLQLLGMPRDLEGTMQIVSSIGQVMFQETISTTDAQSMPINLQGYPSGAYAIRITVKGMTITGMIMHNAE
jgi:hypothetical protein